MNLFSKVAGSPFHVQDGRDFCGAAVGLMMLADTDVGRNPMDLLEADLFSDGAAASKGGFLIDADGLTAMLNKFNGPGRRGFTPSGESSEKSGTALVVSHLCDSSPNLGAVSPAVLVFGDMHWVTVEGIWTDGDPQVKPAGAYKLLFLLIHDPMTTGQPIVNHGVGDECPVRGVSDRYIFYPVGWQDRFDGAVSGGSSLFFVVGREGSAEISGPGEVVLPTLSEMEVRIGVDGLIEISDLIKLWNATLATYEGLPVGSSASAFLSGATPNINSATPVAWPERAKNFYLVNLQSGEDIVGTWVLDAGSGASDSIEIHLPGHPLQSAYERLKAGLSGQRLTWKPCLESFSPHLPFIVSVGQAGAPRFERLDGAVFSGLTTDVKGA